MPIHRNQSLPSFEQSYPIYRQLCLNEPFAVHNHIVCKEVTALLLTKQWVKYPAEQDRRRLMSILLGNGIVWHCPACSALGFSVRESILSLKDLERDLFATEQDIVQYRSAAVVQNNPIVVVADAVEVNASNAAIQNALEASLAPVRRYCCVEFIFYIL